MGVTDLVLFGLVQLVGVVTTIAVLKTEIRWVKDWCDKHERADQQRWRELSDEDKRIEASGRDDRHDMRDALGEVSNRVAHLEGAAGR